MLGDLVTSEGRKTSSQRDNTSILSMRAGKKPPLPEAAPLPLLKQPCLQMVYDVQFVVFFRSRTPQGVCMVGKMGKEKGGLIMNATSPLLFSVTFQWIHKHTYSLEAVSESPVLVVDASSGSSDDVDRGNDPYELTSVICDGATCESYEQNELISVTNKEAITESTALNELTSETYKDGNNETTAPSEWTAASSEGLSNANHDQSQVEKVTCVEPFNESHDQSQVEKVTCVEPFNERYFGGSSLSPSKESSRIKRIVYLIVSSFPFRILGILLTFVDVSLIITDILVSDSTIYIPLEYRAVSLAMGLFFFMDVFLRVSIEGVRRYFSDMLNSLDASIIVVTLLVNIAYFFYDFKFLKNFPKLRIVLLPLRLFTQTRSLHLAQQNRHLAMLTRRRVSENKRRYKKDGFDLDLTYITERIIAMSFPSSGKQSFYRNPIKEVVRFLDTKHQNHYRVYNLCSERAYDAKYFHDRVCRYMIDDHNVPSLSEMVAFSKDVKEWMAQDEENITVIHCKGGKGRTGTMVCAYLLASEIFATAEDSLHYFGERRTGISISSKHQGVETPSQKRFVGYFAMVKNTYKLTLPPVKKLTMKTIIIYSICGVGEGNGNDLKVQIIMQGKPVFFCSASKNCRMGYDAETDRVIINLSNCPALYDEVKVKFLSSCSALPKYYDNCPFFFWFHTSFIQNNRLYLSRSELDNPHKPKAWKIYRPEFAVEVYFDDVTNWADVPVWIMITTSAAGADEALFIRGLGGLGAAQNEAADLTGDDKGSRKPDDQGTAAHPKSTGVR
ncbi:phosphatidylinositol 3,4,5-trisphosphate 3-phosphatase TPTE2-like [Mesoplodon densirostris]|uniref:phosphatidylinositol 3,4,5-trisphosphate 3-phosphatase TPTE2-like n=1 Tax=Mesoplodon densirostris TaxID=48708 RepID=UPI0028DD0FA9|nr:phosphatidylinositol 3,4,5-trisphosphate 3-phosphatase TPTE2-like [Mesoplodon densirostris]